MAFDQTIHETLQRLTASLQQDFDARLKAAAAELARSAEEERLAAEAESMSTLAAEIGAARAEADQRVADEVARVRAEADQASAEEASRLRAELETARREGADLRQEAARAREQSEQVATDLATARARLAGVEQAHEELRNRLATAEQALEEVRAAAASGDHALEELRQSGVEARVQERQEQLARLDRLVAGLRQLDQAASLSDVLTVLAQAVAAEAPRTAILVAAPDGFQPFRLAGFSGITPRSLTRSEAASLTRGLPFASLPPDHVGFAVPIDVGRQAVALVYADDCTGRDEIVPASWPEAVEVLARHAALRLETLTALRTVQALSSGGRAGASPVSTMGRTVASVVAAPSTTEDDQSARRYARLLVSEIKLYNEATVRLGRLNRDLVDRLRPEIERARTLYEQRVPAHVPARSAYFDDELVHTLADGDPALLGSRH